MELIVLFLKIHRSIRGHLRLQRIKEAPPHNHWIPSDAELSVRSNQAKGQPAKRRQFRRATKDLPSGWLNTRTWGACQSRVVKEAGSNTSLLRNREQGPPPPVVRQGGRPPEERGDSVNFGFNELQHHAHDCFGLGHPHLPLRHREAPQYVPQQKQ